MSNRSKYLPIPPRVWSRVQNQCTYVVDISYNSIYVPLINQTLPPTEAIFYDKQINKGNILQYKGNSSRLTKNQKYSQISKGLWCNRTKSYATQSQTYTNPNTTSLQRINAINIPYPNQIVGLPNNISGPYQYNVPNPYNCPTNSIQDGGSLVCNKYVNPCTGEVIQSVSQQQCFPTSCSDVPGEIMDLCWNPKLQSWFPKPRYVMNNSTSKWPEGYKGFVSAITPDAPVLLSAIGGCVQVTLTWSYTNSICTPISSFNIYVDGKFMENVPYTTTTTIIYLNYSTEYSIYITSLSTKIESEPSNSLLSTTLPLLPPTNLTGTPGWCGSITLNWTAASGICAQSYNIYYSDGTFIASVPYTTLSYTVYKLLFNTSYSFYLTSFNHGFNSEHSNICTITSLPLLPPTNLTGISGCRSIVLSWLSSTSCVQSYNIYYSDGTFIASVSSEIISYTIYNLLFNTTYSFYLTSFYSGFNSIHSTGFTLTTSPLLPPTNLTGISGNGSITLSWTASASCAQSYNIYYSDGTFIASVSSAILSYTINNLHYNTSYSFYLTSSNSGYNSIHSTGFTLTTTQLNTPNIAVSSYITTLPIGVSFYIYPGSGATSTSYNYNLYVSDGSTTTITNIPGNGTNNWQTYTLSLQYGYTYTCYITYIASNGDVSPPSSNIQLYTDTYAPINVVASVPSGSYSSAILSWTSPSVFVTGYSIYYYAGSLITTTPSSTISYTINGLMSGDSYTFSVVANYNSSNSSSANSNLVGIPYYYNISYTGENISLSTTTSQTSGALVFTDFTSNCSFNILPGTANSGTINIISVGAGGGGGSASSSETGGGGGGGAGAYYNTASYTNLNSLTSYSFDVTVGVPSNSRTSYLYYGSTGPIAEAIGGTPGNNGESTSGGPGGNNPYQPQYGTASSNGGNGAAYFDTAGNGTYSNSNIVSFSILNSNVTYNLYIGASGGGGSWNSTSGSGGSWPNAPGYGGAGGNANNRTGYNGYSFFGTNTGSGFNFYVGNGGGGGSIPGYNGGNGSQGVVIVYWNSPQTQSSPPNASSTPLPTNPPISTPPPTPTSVTPTPTPTSVTPTPTPTSVTPTPTPTSVTPTPTPTQTHTPTPTPTPTSVTPTPTPITTSSGWKQVLYGANYLPAPSDWTNFFTFAQSCNATHVLVEVLTIGTEPVGNGYSWVSSPYYDFPILGSTSITWAENIVTGVTATFSVSNASDVLAVTTATNSSFYAGASGTLPTPSGFKLLISFGGAPSFGGSNNGGLSNVYTTTTSNFYCGNYPTTLYGDVATFVQKTGLSSSAAYTTLTSINAAQLVNSAYTLGYNIYTYYLTNVNSVYPNFDGIDFDLENFPENDLQATLNNVLYTGVLSMTIKYLSSNSMLVSHAPQPGYFSQLNNNVSSNPPLWVPSIYGTYSSDVSFFLCIYGNIELYFGDYIDWYNIQYYDQGVDFTNTSSYELFNVVQFFVLDYANIGEVGFNASMLQLSQGTSTGGYSSSQTTNTTISSAGYLGYDNSFGDSYCAAGVVNIPLSKLVLGSASVTQAAAYVPLSNQYGYSIADSSLYGTETLQSIVTSVDTLASPQVANDSGSTPVTFTASDVNNWLINGGGIMVYDYDDSSPTSSSNLDVAAYMSGVNTYRQSKNYS